MASTVATESMAGQHLFGVIDLTECADTDQRTRGESRGKTGRLRLVPTWQIERFGQGANLGLGEPRVHQRRGHLIFAGGLVSGAYVVLIFGNLVYYFISYDLLISSTSCFEGVPSTLMISIS